MTAAPMPGFATSVSTAAGVTARPRCAPGQPCGTFDGHATLDRSRARSAQPSRPTEPSAGNGCTGANQVIAPV